MPENNEELPAVSEDDAKAILEENPALAAVAATPWGRKMLLKQATKMLRKKRPDLSEEEISSLADTALGGDLSGLETLLEKLGIIPPEAPAEPKEE
jgi:hypothetical protein